jgi:hypothetical protein
MRGSSTLGQESLRSHASYEATDKTWWRLGRSLALPEPRLPYLGWTRSRMPCLVGPAREAIGTSVSASMPARDPRKPVG